MIEDYKFRTAQSPEGFSLSRDTSMHRRLMNEAERRLRLLLRTVGLIQFSVPLLKS